MDSVVFIYRWIVVVFMSMQTDSVVFMYIGTDLVCTDVLYSKTINEQKHSLCTDVLLTLYI